MAHLRSIVALAGASLASAAMPAQTNWLQQGGNDWRTSAITYNADLPGSKGKSSISHVSMGHHINWQYAGVASSTPVLTPKAESEVIITDSNNHLKGYKLPENQPDGKLSLAFEFKDSGKANGGLLSRYSGTPVLGGAAHAYWVNFQNAQLWGVDTSVMPPVNLPWSPIDLTNAASVFSNGTHFAPEKFTSEHAILMHDSRIWVPAPDEHVALAFNTGSGRWNHTNLKLNGARLQGSVGTTANNGHAVAFTATSFGMQSVSRGGITWWNLANNIPYVPASNEFNHPVLIEIPDSSDRCIIMARPQDGGLRIFGVSPASGQACLNWKPAGYTVRSTFTETPSWVSAPAVIRDGSGFLLYYALNLPNVAGSGQRSSLVAIKVDRFGVLTEDVVNDGHMFTQTHINIAPIAVVNAYGTSGANRHAVICITAVGGVFVFKYKDFGKNGWFHHFTKAAALGGITPSSPTAWIQTAGNYGAASQAGSIFFVAYDTGTKEQFLVSIARAIRGPHKADAPPAPAPSSNAAADTAAAIFGTLGALGVAAAGVVFFAPHYSFAVGGKVVVPADIIKSGAGKVASATSYVASGAVSLAKSAAGKLTGSSGPYASLGGSGSSASTTFTSSSGGYGAASSSSSSGVGYGSSSYNSAGAGAPGVGSGGYSGIGSDL